MKEAFACDAFLEALNDRELALKVREREPPTMEEAYQFAMRLEAYSVTPGSGDREKKPQVIRAVNEQEKSEDGYEKCVSYLREFTQLQNENFHRMFSELKSIVTQKTNDPASCPKGYMPRMPMNYRGGEQYRSRSNNWQGRPPFRGERRCYNCGEEGHFIARCPNPIRTEDPRTNQSEIPVNVTDHLPPTITNHIKGEKGAYLRITIHGVKHLALLDTGSQISLIPRHIVPDLALDKTEQVLHAANGTNIGVMGEVNLVIHLGRTPIPLKCVVVDNVSEVLLGLDWMMTNVENIDFKRKTIVVNDHLHHLTNPPKYRMSRKVVCKEAVTIPPKCEANVIGRVLLEDLAAYECGWASEPTEMENSILVARTMVDDCAREAIIRVLNLKDIPVRIAMGSDVCQLIEVGVSKGAITNADRDGRDDLLDDLCNRMDSSVGEAERRELFGLLQRYRHIFSTDESDMGRTEIIRHEIDTGGNKPVRQSLRPQPLAMLSAIDEHLQKMMKQGLIEPSQSDWASNVVMVKKNETAL